MESNKPERKYKVGGVSAAVFKHNGKTQDGRSFERRKVVLDKTYKDSNDAWQHTNSLDVNDLPKAILALSKAYDALASRGQDENVPEEDVQ